MNERLRNIAQGLAEEHLRDYDYLGVAEQADELGLTDDEVDQVHDLITYAKVVIPND